MAELNGAVCSLKLTSGEELFGKVRFIGNGTTGHKPHLMSVKNPATIMMMEKGQAPGIVPFLQLSQAEEIQIEGRHVITMSPAPENLRMSWEKAFGSGLDLPAETSLILPH